MSSCKNHKTCTNEALKNAKMVCKKKGVKLTKLRETVLKLIWKSHSYVKAYDLLEDLQRIDNSAKPPTVYRSLDFLMEHGLIHKIQSLNAYVGCSHPDAHDSCYFLICNECQNIEEHCSININDIVKNNSGGKSFLPNQVTLEISGVCGECT